MARDVMSGVTKMAWDVMSGVTKTAWDVLSGVANLCGIFWPGCKKMAWDVLSRDVLSGSRMVYLVYTTYICVNFAHHEIFRAKVGKGCINTETQARPT